MEAVSEELEFQGYEPVTALNTIRNDLDYIGATYPNVKIVGTKSGRNKTYSYEDPNSSIYKLQLSDEELGQLSQCMAILSKFEGLPQMEWLESFMVRFKLSLNIDPEGIRVVGFDVNKFLVGRDHFSKLLAAISNKNTISISYKSFKENKHKQIIVYPYYIKEYNNRWFLLGRTKGYNTISTFAFDRIKEVQLLVDEPYIPNIDIDFNDEYFSDMIGVTRPADSSIQRITLRVTNDLFPYIATKPIHETQKIKHRESEYVDIEIQVYVNYELKQLLLSFGEGVKVLSPNPLANEIKSRLEKALINYQ
ncbi:MAG: WYL domain-containing protein [Paramuribaculum sp.]|nr:WYL domain-containing protein [Paramuribaculum sp.]